MYLLIWTIYIGTLLSFGAIWWVKLSQQPWWPSGVTQSECMKMVLPTGTPFHQRCLGAFSYALYQTGVKEDGNLKLWCMVQHDEEHITTYMGYGYVLFHNPALEYRHSTGQYWYISLPGQTQLRYLYLLLSNHHSLTSSGDLAIMITPFSAQTLEQRHLSTRLHSSHPPAEICSEWMLDLDEQLFIPSLDEQLFMANSNPCGYNGHWCQPM